MPSEQGWPLARGRRLGEKPVCRIDQPPVFLYRGVNSEHLHIGCNERKWEANFAGSAFTRSDFTNSTMRLRTSGASNSMIALWHEAGAAKDQPSTPFDFAICEI